jgi:hypothetical protein
MLYITSYKVGEKQYCCVKFSNDNVRVEAYGRSFIFALIKCLLKGLIIDINMKIKKLLR